MPLSGIVRAGTERSARFLNVAGPAGSFLKVATSRRTPPEKGLVRCEDCAGSPYLAEGLLSAIAVRHTFATACRLSQLSAKRYGFKDFSLSIYISAVRTFDSCCAASLECTMPVKRPMQSLPANHHTSLSSSSDSVDIIP